jgi:hypothetical protein
MDINECTSHTKKTKKPIHEEKDRHYLELPVLFPFLLALLFPCAYFIDITFGLCQGSC